MPDGLTRIVSQHAGVVGNKEQIFGAATVAGELLTLTVDYRHIGAASRPFGYPARVEDQRGGCCPRLACWRRGLDLPNRCSIQDSTLATRWRALVR